MEKMDSEPSTFFRNRRINTSTLIVGGLLAVALLWRLVFFLEMYASPYGENLTLDSAVYHEVAVEVAQGKWSSGSTFFQAPLYPWTLGVFYSVSGVSQTTAKLLQILLSVATCWLIYRVAGRTFDHRVAQVALAISSVYGMYLYFSNELLVVTLIVFLDFLGLELLLRASDGERKALWGVAGVAFGLSAIARPTILPFVAAVCFWIVVTGWRTGRLKSAVVETLVFIVGAALPIAPVTLHNYLADGDLVLVASNGGFNFYIGNNPQSDGITASAPGMRADLRGASSDQARAAGEGLGKAEASPKEISGYWYEMAWSDIRSEPGRAFRHTIYKAWVLFNAHEVSNNRVIEFATRHSSIFSWATLRFWLIFPLALAGAVVGGGRRSSKSLLVVFAVVYTATLVPFFVNARFRMPVVAVFIIFASAAVVAWFQWLRTRPLDRQIGQRLAISAVVALVAAIVVQPARALRVPDAQAFFNEAEAYRAQNDLANAATWYGKALDEYTGYCDAAYNLARIHTIGRPDLDRIIAVLESAVDSCTEDYGIHRLLGLTLLEVGRRDEGEQHLRIARELDPGLWAMQDNYEWGQAQ